MSKKKDTTRFKLEMDISNNPKHRIRPLADQGMAQDNDPSHVFKHPFLIAIPAKRGSGKTTVMINMLLSQYKDFFHRIYIWSPTMHQEAMQCIKLNPDHCFEQYNDTQFLDIIKDLKKSEGERALMILDDITGSNILKQRANNEINKFFFNHRHFPKALKKVGGTSIMMAIHSYNMIPRPIRINLTGAMVFRTFEDKEIEIIRQDLKRNLSDEQFNILFQFATANKHDFLCVNLTDDECPFRKNFDTVIKIKEIDNDDN